MRRNFAMSLAAVAITAVFVGEALAQQPDAAQMQKMREEALERFKKQAEERQREFAATWDRVLPVILAPAPASPWQEKERLALLDLVVQAKPRVLVVPPTMPEGAPGIDVTARVTIARLLAASLEAEVGPIPDPGLVYRVLGEARTLSIAEIRRRLGRTSAEWLIVGSVQRQAGKLRISFSRISARTPADSDSLPGFSLDGIEFGGAIPPEVRLATSIPDAASALGYKGGTLVEPNITKSSGLTLPKSLSDAGDADASTLAGVWMQQLLGALQVPYVDALPRSQERVFERTLAALMVLPRSTPDRAVLLARAFAYLDRREAALKALEEGSGTPEEKAFLAYLNSDLPALQIAVARITRPVAKLIAELELLGVRNAFNAVTDSQREAAAQKLSAAVPAAWQQLVAIHVFSANLWTLPSSASVKPLLDRDFPVPGYTIEDIARGKAALGARQMDQKLEAEILLSPLVHARRWRDANAKELCCRTGPAAWRQTDRSQYLDLLEADADRLAVARLEFLDRVQGRPEAMRSLADAYDQAAFGGGHPGVTHQRMLSSYEAGRKSAGDRSQLWLDAFENSRKLLTWEPAQSFATASALSVRVSTFHVFLGPSVAAPNLPPHPMESDVPTRSRWGIRAGSFVRQFDRRDFALAAARDACANMIAWFQVCADYIQALRDARRKADIEPAVAALIRPRFNGSAQRLEFLASVEQEKGDSNAARALLQQAIEAPQAPESAYKALGQLLLGEGEFPAAAAAFGRYPGLKDSSQNRVEISNYASRAGYDLVRKGAIKEGRPLLARAASNGDGSYANLWSAGQLALMDGDYRRSLDFFQQTYQRYRTPATPRAIASLLFAIGERDAAWGALSQVLPTTREFAPYRAAPVGLRIAGADATALLEWYNGMKEKQRAASGQDQHQEFLLNGFLQTLLIDRPAGAYDDLFETMSEQMRPPGAPVIPRAQRKFAPPDPLGPNAGPFRKAYDAFHRNDHTGAIEAWGQQVRSFDYNAYPPQFGSVTGDTFWSGMPYFAISLVKSGRAAEAAKLPERLTRDGRPEGSRKVPEGFSQVPMPEFDRKMIAGIVAAYAGDHARAQRLLRGALGSMAEPGTRLIPPEYAYAEILEMLAKDTGQRAYLTMAVEFATAFRQYEPWAAWAYAFEAAYLPAGPDQLRATVAALKLDPKSMRLGRLDPKLLERAREELSRNDPFRLKLPAKEAAPRASGAGRSLEARL